MVQYDEINCAGPDCDWDRYPNTGHGCERPGCKAEATVAVVLGSMAWMSCDADKGTFTNSTYVAHVAEALLFFDGTLSYDTAAQRAAELLAAHRGLVMAADSYSQGTIGADPFYRRVKDLLRQPPGDVRYCVRAAGLRLPASVFGSTVEEINAAYDHAKTVSRDYPAATVDVLANDTVVRTYQNGVTIGRRT